MVLSISGLGIDVPTIFFHITISEPYLLEMKYPLSSWVMWNTGTFTKPCILTQDEKMYEIPFGPFTWQWQILLVICTDIGDFPGQCLITGGIAPRFWLMFVLHDLMPTYANRWSMVWIRQPKHHLSIDWTHLSFLQCFRRCHLPLLYFIHSCYRTSNSNNNNNNNKNATLSDEHKCRSWNIF